jgi:hypothetical protein
LLWSSSQSEGTLSAYYGQGVKKYLRHSKRRAAIEVGRSWMQYVVTGGFGTVEEAVWVESNESMLAYCTLLQLSGISQPTIAKSWWACFLGAVFGGKGSSVAGLVCGLGAWGFNFCARGFNFVILIKYAAQL